jgi:hypothetical protein
MPLLLSTGILADPRDCSEEHSRCLCRREMACDVKPAEDKLKVKNTRFFTLSRISEQAAFASSRVAMRAGHLPPPCDAFPL